MATIDVLVCRNVAKTYSYLCAEEIAAGVHVKVPFGKSECEGVVLGACEAEDIEGVKAIIGVDEKKPVLSLDLLELIRWFSGYYRVSLFGAYQAVVGKRKLRDVGDLDGVLKRFQDDEGDGVILNHDQKLALESILTGEARQLLFGVTASGKTEVYIRAASAVLDEGKSVLILLPEIALTPQVRDIFVGRFGDSVAVLHSGLTPKAREIQWNRIYRGHARVVIGPRSAVFSPLEKIGLIVIDEAHEATYKQDNHPRYDARKVAEYRAEQHGARLVLGTATPSLEQLYAAKRGDMGLIRMMKRVRDLPLPQIHLVDMREEDRSQGTPLFSAAFLAALGDRLEKKEKTMVLLNRRGFGSYVVCGRCGEVYACESCGLSYTFHQDRKFRCHRCDVCLPAHNMCPKCQQSSLLFSGMGTQKVEYALKQYFPGIKVCRLDRDAVKTAAQMEAVLDEFKASADVLVGTQMIAKGHDISDVSLVGVLGIDSVMGLPDFRSSERAFQLLSQVAGRAGRGDKAGAVFVQSFQTDHYVMDFLLRHDYEGFFEMESGFRESLFYPPYSTLIHVIISSEDEKLLRKEIEKAGVYFSGFQEKFVGKIQVMGPKPAPIERVRAHYRWDVVIKVGPEFYDEVKLAIEVPRLHRRVRVIVDYDAVSLL